MGGVPVTVLLLPLSDTFHVLALALFIWAFRTKAQSVPAPRHTAAQTSKPVRSNATKRHKLFVIGDLPWRNGKGSVALPLASNASRNHFRNRLQGGSETSESCRQDF